MPVTRINAEALHYTVLHEMERAVRHHTVMHKLIAQSGGWGDATEAQKAVRAQLAKRKQFLDVRAENYLKAIGEGRALDALLAALEKTEEEKKQVNHELAQADQQIAAATIKRPTAEQVQQVWRELVDLWDE